MKAATPDVKEKYWLDHIRQAEQSGETFKRYAERHGLNLKSLYDWRSRLKKRCVLDAPARSVAKKAMTFAKVIAAPSSPRAVVELRVGAVTLCMESLPDPAWLANLVHALELRS
jgi:transposase-like protein